jgi:hypothetical protein
MAEDLKLTQRQNAMLATLRSVSRVFGKQDEYENFVPYVKWG